MNLNFLLRNKDQIKVPCSMNHVFVVSNLKININALKFGLVSPSLLKYEEELHTRYDILSGVFAGL